MRGLLDNFAVSFERIIRYFGRVYLIEKGIIGDIYNSKVVKLLKDCFMDPTEAFFYMYLLDKMQKEESNSSSEDTISDTTCCFPVFMVIVLFLIICAI